MKVLLYIHIVVSLSLWMVYYIFIEVGVLSRVVLSDNRNHARKYFWVSGFNVENFYASKDFNPASCSKYAI